MDPEETLRNAREAAAALMDDEPMSYEAQAAAGVELARAFSALDEWLKKGGFPPADWHHPNKRASEYRDPDGTVGS